MAITLAFIEAPKASKSKLLPGQIWVDASDPNPFHPREYYAKVLAVSNDYVLYAHLSTFINPKCPATNSHTIHQFNQLFTQRVTNSDDIPDCAFNPMFLNPTNFGIVFCFSVTIQTNLVTTITNISPDIEILRDTPPAPEPAVPKANPNFLHEKFL